MRRLRILVNLSLLLFPLAILGLVTSQIVGRLWAYLNSDARLAGVLSAEASRALRRTVTVRDVTFITSPWALIPNRIRISGVRISSGANAASASFASADQVTVWYDPAQLLFAQDRSVPLVSEVQVRRPAIRIQRDAAGQWNFAQLLKPRTSSGRPFTDKISVADGTVDYDDRAFPHPSGVPRRRFATRLDHVSGILLVRPDRSLAFDFGGQGGLDLVDGFKLTGIIGNSPLSFDVRLRADRLNAPNVARYLLAPTRGSVTTGLADLDLSLLYNPAQSNRTSGLELNAIEANGVVHLAGWTLRAKPLDGQVNNLNGDLLLTRDTASGGLSGRFASADFSVQGRVLGLSRLWQRVVLQATPASVSVHGALHGGDFGRIVRALGLTSHLSGLPVRTRYNILSALATGDLSYDIEGAVDNPAAVVRAHLTAAQYDMYRASNIQLRAFYADHTVDADARGTFADGAAVVRGHVATNKDGLFEIEAHGRNLNLAKLRYLTSNLQGGTADLDFAIRGRTGRTPFITAQAQAANLEINNQHFSSVYARAVTLGRNLQVRSLRVEDDKGFALATGSVDLSRQSLDLNVEADELDLGAIIKAFRKGTPSERTAGAGLFTEVTSGKSGALAPTLGPLQGVGYLRAHIGGTFRMPRAAGRLSAFAIESGDIDLDQANADFEMTPDVLKISSGRALVYPGELSFSGVVSQLRRQDARLQIQAQATNFDVNDLAAMVGIRAPTDSGSDTRSIVLTGHVGTDPIEIGGTLKSPRLVRPAIVRLTDGVINGLPLETATAAISYGEKGVRLEHSEVVVAGGTATASGTVSSSGALDLDLTGHGFKVASLLTATPQPDALLVGGTAGFEGHFGGTTRDIEVTGRLQGDGLTYRDFALGDLRADASYLNKKFVLTDVKLLAPDGSTESDRIGIPQFTYNIETSDIAGTVTWTEVPLERLRRLLSQLPFADQEAAQSLVSRFNRVPTAFGGAVSGDAMVSGTASAPLVDVSLLAHDLTFDQQAVTRFAVSARVDRNGVVSPSPTRPQQMLRLDSPDGTVAATSIAIGFGRVEDPQANASIRADISAYNINLGAIQHFPNLVPEAAALDLSGTADLFLAAHGVRTHPILQASATVRHLSYEGRSFDNIQITNLLVQEPRIQSDLIQFTKSYLRKSNTAGMLQAQVQGTVGFEWKYPFVTRDAPLDITAELPSQDLDALTALSDLATGANASRLSLDTDGHFQARVQVSNTLDKPQVVGNIALDAGHVKFGDVHTEIRDLHGEIDFDRNSITIPAGFRATTYVTAANVPDKNRAGTAILVSGSLPILEPSDVPGAPGITIREDRLPFDEAPLPGLKTGSVSGDASIDLVISGSLIRPLARGTLGIQNAQLLPPSDLGAGVGAGFRFPVNPAFDLTVRIGKNVRVRNSALTARIDGDVVVRGRLFQPESASVAAATPVTSALPASRPLAVRLFGSLSVREGRLTLPTARFNIVPPGTITLNYPTFDPSQPGQQLLGVNIDAKAQTYLALPSGSTFSGRKRYLVTVTVRGALTGLTEDPTTGRSRLALTFTTDPPDFEGNQQALQQRLASALGGEAIGELGRNPGQVVSTQLTNILTSSVLPSLFDRPAAALGFEQLALAYDPIQHLSVVLSRHIVGPLYVTYIRSLADTLLSDITVSLRFSDRYQLSFEQDEQMTQTVLLEGVWRF